MKKDKKFWKKVFAMIHVSFGYMPFPQEYMESDESKEFVLKLWDGRLGMYDKTTILEAVENCIVEEKRTPNLVTVLSHVKKVEQERRYAAQNEQFRSGRFDCD